jgi:ribosome-associated heat shock protein Hsp15
MLPASAGWTTRRSGSTSGCGQRAWPRRARWRPRPVTGGRVHLNGKATKPSKDVKPGDRIEMTIGAVRRTVDVRATSDKRGPAAVAQALYEETPGEHRHRERDREQRRLATPPMPDVGGGRPSATGGASTGHAVAERTLQDSLAMPNDVDVVLASNAALNRRDVDGMLAVYAPDAEVVDRRRVGFGSFAGRDELHGLYTGIVSSAASFTRTCRSARPAAASSSRTARCARSSRATPTGPTSAPSTGSSSPCATG